ncbi:MAG: YtxH domain-containing protein [Clostridia bacterium]|nr:YtxH domain-containing protein [Clostridia bacterium]
MWFQNRFVNGLIWGLVAGVVVGLFIAPWGNRAMVVVRGTKKLPGEARKLARRATEQVSGLIRR